MIEFNHTLTIDEGMHARPAGGFVKKAQGYAEKITVTKGSKKVDAKRLFSVINLQVGRGEKIVITVEGDNETKVAEELKGYCTSTL
ncbi:MAG: HPr family phosphocarrier protein [Treponema sp.]|nr:HPr family phosphocarrier protein [Treponema sp.]